MKIKLLLIVACCPFMILAQGGRKNSLSFQMDFHDYGVKVLDKKFTNFDSTFSQSYRIGYNRLLSNTFLFSTGLSNGLLWNDQLESTQMRKNYAIGIDATAIIMSNNGKIFRKNAPFSPYFTFGYQYYYINKLKKLGYKPNNWSVQYGLGFNLNLQKQLSFQIQSSLNQQLGGKYTTHFIHRIGFCHVIDFAAPTSDQESKPSIKTNDYDNDGILDVADQCPTMPGTQSSFGCPEGYLEKEAKNRAKLDSIEALVLKLKTKMEHIDSDLATLNKLKSSKSKAVAQDEASKPKVETKPIDSAPKNTNTESNSSEIEVVRESTNSYYVVTISALDERFAVAEAQKIKASYPNVKVIAQPNGFYRTAIYSGTDKQEAILLLQRVTNNGTKQAWIAFY